MAGSLDQNQYVTGAELIIDGGWLLAQRECCTSCLLSFSDQPA